MQFKPFSRSKPLLFFSLFLYLSAFMYADLLLSYFNVAKNDQIYLLFRCIIFGLKGLLLAYLILTNKDRLFQARSFLFVVSVYLLSGVISVLLNYQLFPIVFDLYIKLFTNTFPIVLAFITTSSSEELYEALLSLSYIQIPLVIFYPFSSAYLIQGAYMTYGYGLMIYWGIILLKKNKRFYDYLILIIWIIFYVVYANRGALFCLVGIFFIYLLMFTSVKRKTILVSSFISISVVLLTFKNAIISLLEALSSSPNIASRTIQLILKGDFLSSTGRNIFYDNAIKLINENPFGYGLGYDRLASADLGMKPVYVHNIFLELLLNYGVIAGTVIIVMIIIMGLTVLLSKNIFSETYKRVFAAFYVMGLIQLLFSSSVFESIYLATALLTTIILNENQEIIL